MIELSLELKLDAFLVNSMGKSEDLSSQMSARALRFSCEKVVSARQLRENKPSADFEFLGSAGKRESQVESDQEFDEKFFHYLATHTTVDTSRVNIAAGDSGYVPVPKATSSGEIGRMYIPRLQNQSSIGLELVFRQDEFDAAWELVTHQKVRKAVATLVCFKLSQGAPAGQGEYLFVAGVLSCSLQFAPGD
ncbi:hypothetical protein MIZ01_2553 [Sideroxyarcus emersonii]|uniref:Uncharacterized protein n=1 Tax=Sideroxyarcus emersonii TaxID=2764705 RepID=A0AAN2C0J0_9PROT|nr:hypothetical protein [Sideroxyarcus emersonii]BCK88747.1 hypothetical protein MIZ01_2553 [Sideroxyarcus emersonii]